MRRNLFTTVSIYMFNNPILSPIAWFLYRTGIADFAYGIVYRKQLKARYKFFENHFERILDNTNCLADEESKKAYVGMIGYRCTRKRKWFPKIYKPQYFLTDILNFSDNEVFIDCGAYTGDTIDKFIETVDNKFKRIVAFEPDENKFFIISDLYTNKDFVGHDERISIYNSGVYNIEAEVPFAIKEEGSSAISTGGTNTIKTVVLDNCEDCQDATFIKMDIEGAELNALHGAKNIITKNKPKLAICIYHSDSDMIDIIEFIRNTFPFYKIYVRHHEKFENETVMYCVPKEIENENP